MKQEYLDYAVSERERLGISKRRFSRPPMLVFPRTIERKYERLLDDYSQLLIKDAHSVFKRQVKTSDPRQDGEHFDGVGENFLYDLKVGFDDLFSTFVGLGKIDEIGNELLDHTVKTARKQEVGMFGVAIFENDAELRQQVANWSKQNTLLVKDLTNDTYQKINNAVQRGIVEGRSVREIEKEIFSKSDLTPLNSGQVYSTKSIATQTRARARLIAIDQVGKANSLLTRKRQEELGIESYKWLNSQDERVRGNPKGIYPSTKYNHWNRNETVYKWTSPPPDGHAGMPIRCRCVAGANMQEYEDILKAETDDSEYAELKKIREEEEALVAKEQAVLRANELREKTAQKKSSDALKLARLEEKVRTEKLANAKLKQGYAESLSLKQEELETAQRATLREIERNKAVEKERRVSQLKKEKAEKAISDKRRMALMEANAEILRKEKLLHSAKKAPVKKSNSVQSDVKKQITSEQEYIKERQAYSRDMLNKGEAEEASFAQKDIESSLELIKSLKRRL